MLMYFLSVATSMTRVGTVKGLMDYVNCSASMVFISTLETVRSAVTFYFPPIIFTPQVFVNVNDM
jgi:hypothetical protein